MSSANYTSTLLGLRRLWSYLPPIRKKQFALIVFFMLLSSFVELVSVGSLVPLLNILTNSSSSFDKYFQIAQNYFPFHTLHSNKLLLVGSIFIAFSFLSSAIRMLNVWINGEYVAIVGSELGTTVLAVVLNDSYLTHVTRNSSEIVSLLTRQVERCVQGLYTFLQFTLSSLITLFIVCGLLLFNFQVSILLFSILTVSYILILSFTRQYIKKNSKLQLYSFNKIVKLISEAMTSFSQVLLGSRQEYYLNNYFTLYNKYRKINNINLLIGIFPRYTIEFVGISSLVLFTYYISITDPTKSTVAVVGVFALAFQKLLPLAQQIYNSLTNIIAIDADIHNVLEYMRPQYDLKQSFSDNKLLLTSEIVFENVSFTYPGSSQMVLSSANLSIPANSSVGIVGSTGSGKSTLVDILIGLIPPDTGIVRIDGIEIYNKQNLADLVSWRKNVAYVPQTIPMLDATIFENIAFGVAYSEINKDKVKLACKIACIEKVIDSLPQKFDELIGENGIKLSGGQLQRLGIARAIYSDAKVLVLDEATSALDKETERQVMASIEATYSGMTIIMIAHRTSTLRNCDFIIEIKDGQAVKTKP